MFGTFSFLLFVFFSWVVTDAGTSESDEFPRTFESLQRPRGSPKRIFTPCHTSCRLFLVGNCLQDISVRLVHSLVKIPASRAFSDVPFARRISICRAGSIPTDIFFYNSVGRTTDVVPDENLKRKIRRYSSLNSFSFSLGNYMNHVLQFRFVRDLIIIFVCFVFRVVQPRNSTGIGASSLVVYRRFLVEKVVDCISKKTASLLFCSGFSFVRLSPFPPRPSTPVARYVVFCFLIPIAPEVPSRSYFVFCRIVSRHRDLAYYR